MFANAGKTGVVMFLAITLSACAGGGSIEDVNSASDGPDEFSVLPGKPLQSPQDFANLPVPTPGGQNLTDPTPHADAISALGGRRSAVSRNGIPAADAALLAYTSRYGVASDIRADLAPRNANRRGRGFFGRLFSGAGGQLLDKYRELERLRTAGVSTPSAPPRP